jgi:predicted nucleotidyltransferase
MVDAVEFNSPYRIGEYRSVSRDFSATCDAIVSRQLAEELSGNIALELPDVNGGYMERLFPTSRGQNTIDSCTPLSYFTPERSSLVPPAIEIHTDRVAEFCAKHRIRRLALFGSVLRPDFRPESDVDVLAEFEVGVAVGYFGLARIERELSALLGGRKVDLRTPEDLSRYFRSSVIAGAYVIHGPS